MKKKIFILSIALTFLSLAVQNVLAAAGDVTLLPASSEVNCDTTFDIEVHGDTEGSLFGVYQFKITYNPDLISLTNDDPCSVETGADGFLTIVNCMTPGEIVVNGFDINGKGPATDLHILTVHFKTAPPQCDTEEYPTTEPIDILVEHFGDPLGAAIGNPNGQGANVIIDCCQPYLVTMKKWSIIKDKKIVDGKDEVTIKMKHCTDLDKAVENLAISSVVISIGPKDKKPFFTTTIPGNLFKLNKKKTKFKFIGLIDSQKHVVDYLLFKNKFKNYKIRLKIRKLNFDQISNPSAVNPITVRVTVGGYIYESTGTWKIKDNTIRTKMIFK